MTPEAILKLAWIPFVTALIGWLTNWVAIRMLFRPRQPIRVFFWQWQGLLPRRHMDIADKIAELVEKELLSQHVIRAELERLDVKGYLDDFIHRIVRQKLGSKLKSIPIIGGMINDASLGMLEKAAKDAVHEEIVPMRKRLADDLEGHLQVRDLVRARIEAFEMNQLESLVKAVAAKELRAIEWLGGVLGFVVGVIQVVILLFVI